MKKFYTIGETVGFIDYIFNKIGIYEYSLNYKIENVLSPYVKRYVKEAELSLSVTQLEFVERASTAVRTRKIMFRIDQILDLIMQNIYMLSKEEDISRGNSPILHSNYNYYGITVDAETDKNEMTDIYVFKLNGETIYTLKLSHNDKGTNTMLELTMYVIKELNNFLKRREI
jgi:hypothetical protein